MQGAWNVWKPQGKAHWDGWIDPACRRSGAAARSFCTGTPAGEASQAKVRIFHSHSHEIRLFTPFRLVTECVCVCVCVKLSGPIGNISS